eukprot:441822-Alexandrium_andersonii.AAC.1
MRSDTLRDEEVPVTQLECTRYAVRRQPRRSEELDPLRSEGGGPARRGPKGGRAERGRSACRQG